MPSEIFFAQKVAHIFISWKNHMQSEQCTCCLFPKKDGFLTFALKKRITGLSIKTHAVYASEKGAIQIVLRV